MATIYLSEAIQRLRRDLLRGDDAALTSGQLLGCFLKHGDEAAFAAIVRRHGPMVWGVCHRLLPNPQDAEDAFQATFLVLVRKAASVVPREMIPNWLYGVAHKTALKARATAARTRERERQVSVMPEPEAVQQDLWRNLQPLLDQELSRLPEKYRVPVVLCDLEGKTRKEAAQLLGWPEGTVAGRLARARAVLAKRLARHGLAVSAGSLAAVLAENAAAACVPTSVLSSAIKAATLFAARQVVAAKVVALTEGVLKAMLLTKLKPIVAVLMVLGMVAFGGTLLNQHTATARQGEGETLSDGAEKAEGLRKSAFKDEEKAIEKKADGVKKLLGTWSTDSSTINGKERKEEKGVDLEFKDELVIIREPAHKNAIVMSVKSPSPRGDIAFGFTRQQPSTSTALMFTYAIYKIEGDTLTLCIQSAYTIPEDFSDKDQVRWVLKRKGADKAKLQAGKVVKGLIASAELVEKPGLFEVRLSLKNVSDKAITICYCPYMSQNQVQWIGPDGKMLTSKHNNWPPSNFGLTKDYFVAIQPGEVRHIVPTIRFHTSTEKRGNEPIRKDLGIWDQIDQQGNGGGSGDRSNLVSAGEHRVTVSYSNTTEGYPVGFGPGGRPGPVKAVENVWLGTVKANEVTFKVK